jgi:hypothetical protein
MSGHVSLDSNPKRFLVASVNVERAITIVPKTIRTHDRVVFYF